VKQQGTYFIACWSWEQLGTNVIGKKTKFCKIKFSTCYILTSILFANVTFRFKIKELRNEERELRKEKLQARYFVIQKSYGHDICTSFDEVLRHFQI
jgi:hypothetical protein